MGLAEAVEIDHENSRLAHECRVACDRLNDALSACANAGLIVEVELSDTASSNAAGFSERKLVTVNPYLKVRY